MKRSSLERRVAYALSFACPAVNPRVKAYGPYIERLDFYRDFLSHLKLDDRFDAIASDIYNALMEGMRVRERDYRKVVDSLEWEIEKGITELIMEMRESGSEEKADLMDKYLTDRDFHVLYRIILGVISEELQDMSLYKNILGFFSANDIFQKYGGKIYELLKQKKWVSEVEYKRAEEALEREVLNRMKDRIKELRAAGYGREADKAEDFLKIGDLENAFHVLTGISEIKKVEYEDVNAKQFMNLYMDNFDIITLLSRAGVDVSDIKWKMGELLNINSIKIPDERVILVDDPSGNAACFLSLYLKRIGVKYTFFSTTGIGDFWITNVETDNRISPTLQASQLGERIMDSKGLVILEDINYLIYSNKFSEVYRFLYYVKNSVNEKIIMTANLSVLSDRERARLQSIADTIIKINFPINICSSNLVAVENRPMKGALLLSKERVDDFAGEVYIISDFGGGNALHPQRIDFEIADKISEFIDSGDVIIDALDMLIDENGIEKIYIWLKFVRDIAHRRGKRVYVVTRDLVANERTFVRSLFDFDMFLVANIDKKKLSFVHKELKTIKRILEKRVEKECVYTLEIIKHRYQKYRKYLPEIEDDVKKLRGIKNYDVDCILKVAPIRMEIDSRVERIESILSDIRDRKEEINSLIPVLGVYIDLKELRDCMEKTKSLIDSGEYEEALDNIKECESTLKYLQRNALSKAWSIREEITCVDYLLPPYLQEKVREFEGEKEKLKDFTILYVSVKNLLSRKIKNEYDKLVIYGKLSGIELFDLSEILEKEQYCEYKKLRDEFMEKFDGVKESIVSSLKDKILTALKILESRNYDVHQIFEDVNAAEDIDSIIDIRNRVSHHLTRYVENYFTNIRERCPHCINENFANYLEEFRRDPLNNLDKLQEMLENMDEKVKKEELMMKEVTRELEGYYSILDEYGVEYEREYPRNLSSAKRVLERVQSVVESLTPDVYVELNDWKIDETRNLIMNISLKNPGPHPAKNITVEIHGALSYKFKIDEIEGGKEEKVDILSEVRDPNSAINVDVVYEGPGGKIATKSFKFEPNLKGYTVHTSNGTEKCTLCRGKIFEGTPMVICSECGATYHLQCAKRIGKCRICGNTFLF